MLLVCGVEVHKDETKLCGSIHNDKPLDIVGGPNGNAITVDKP
jgi:hypothetical protein